MAKNLKPTPTAPSELRNMLSGNFAAVSNAYAQIDSIMKGSLSDNKKHEQAEPYQESICSKEFDLVESASLRLRKFIHLGADCKRFEIKAVCDRINKSSMKRNSSSWALPAGVEAGGKSILLRLEGRLVIHLAGGILENAGMCIHPHFNCPFIPGSGVKGVARHAAWAKWDETKSVEDALKVAWTFGYPTGDKKGLDAFLAQQKPEWFGEDGIYKTFAGSVAFLPAFPVEGDFKAVADIITCHHPDYYGGRKETATDDESPNPQFIPAIEAGSLFRFVVRPLGRMVGTEIPSSETVLAWAEQFLVEGMTLYGAGAKTAAGYGWFSYNQEEERARQAQQEQVLRRREFSERCTCFLAELEATEIPAQDQFDAMQKKMEELIADANAKKMELVGKQRMEEALSRMKKSLPQASPLDQLRSRWNMQLPKAIINGEIARFERQKSETKPLIVELLREKSGIGFEIWNQVRQGQKGDIAKGVDAIRAYCKNELKIGKMP